MKDLRPGIYVFLIIALLAIGLTAFASPMPKPPESVTKGVPEERLAEVIAQWDFERMEAEIGKQYLLWSIDEKNEYHTRHLAYYDPDRTRPINDLPREGDIPYAAARALALDAIAKKYGKGALVAADTWVDGVYLNRYRNGARVWTFMFMAPNPNSPGDVWAAYEVALNATTGQVLRIHGDEDEEGWG